MSEEFLKLIDILRKRRIELGYSMRGLARESGTNHSYIFDLEHSCSARIDIEKIIKICDVLDLDFYDILVESGLLFRTRKFECYEVDVYFDGELFYKFDVSEVNEERAVDLLTKYLYSNDLIDEDSNYKICFKVKKKIPKSKYKKVCNNY